MGTGRERVNGLSLDGSGWWHAATGSEGSLSHTLVWDRNRNFGSVAARWLVGLRR